MFRNRIFKALINLILLTLIFSVAWITPAHAATVWTVNSTNNPGDGICNVLECTLLEVITVATSGDTIVFNLSYPATITMSGYIYLNKDLTIIGPGADNLTISGNYKQVSFGIYPNRTVSLSGLTFLGSSGYDGFILNAGSLSITESVFSKNSRHPSGAFEK